MLFVWAGLLLLNRKALHSVTTNTMCLLLEAKGRDDSRLSAPLPRARSSSIPHIHPCALALLDVSGLAYRPGIARLMSSFFWTMRHPAL